MYSLTSDSTFERKLSSILDPIRRKSESFTNIQPLSDTVLQLANKQNKAIIKAAKVSIFSTRLHLTGTFSFCFIQNHSSRILISPEHDLFFLRTIRIQYT